MNAGNKTHKIFAPEEGFDGYWGAKFYVWEMEKSWSKAIRDGFDFDTYLNHVNSC